MIDGKEQIEKCLSCEKQSCTKCLSDNAEGNGRKGKKVAVTINGIVTIYESKSAAARALGIRHGNFFRAVKLGKWKDYLIVEV